MINRLLLRVLLGLGCVIGFVCQEARAQYPYTRPPTSPYFRPPISPYLNLLRGGSPAINYYTGVLPEQQLYRAFQQLNQQVAMNEQQLGEVEAQAMVPTTGHPAYFMNMSHYYLSGGGLRPQTHAATHTSASASHRPNLGYSAGSFVPRR